MRLSTLSIVLLALVPVSGFSGPIPDAVPGDFPLRNFRFGTGEVLPELRLHYRTIGTPRRDAAG